MCLPPMAWQIYDVDFTAARYDPEGKLECQDHGETQRRCHSSGCRVARTTTGSARERTVEDGPIYLQNHGNPVRYRNIWVRPRDIEGGAETDRSGFDDHSAVVSTCWWQTLVGELNCTGCHSADQKPASWCRQNSPILDKVERVHPEWLVDFIANPMMKPGTTMPDLMSGLSPEARRIAIALTNFLVAGSTVDGWHRYRRSGRTDFSRVRCTACHMPRDGRKASADTPVPLVGLKTA